MTPEVRAFLQRHRVGHLATADAAAAPHVIPVCFALLGETVYSALDQKPKRGSPRHLKRVRNVLENPRAALVVDDYDEDWSRIGYVLLLGAARLVEDGAEHERALHALRDKYPQYRTMDLETRPVIALAVARVVAWGTLEGDPPGC